MVLINSPVCESITAQIICISYSKNDSITLIITFIFFYLLKFDMKNTVTSIFFFTFLLKIKFTDANMLNSHRLVGTPGAPESCLCIRSTAPTS